MVFAHIPYHAICIYVITCRRIHSIHIQSLSKKVGTPVPSYTPHPPWLENGLSATLRHYADIQAVADRVGEAAAQSKQAYETTAVPAVLQP